MLETVTVKSLHSLFCRKGKNTCKCICFWLTCFYPSSGSKSKENVKKLHSQLSANFFIEQCFTRSEITVLGWKELIFLCLDIGKKASWAFTKSRPSVSTLKTALEAISNILTQKNQLFSATQKSDFTPCKVLFTVKISS